MKTVLKENHVYIEKVRALISQFSYTVVMMNMNLLSVLTSTSIYHGYFVQRHVQDTIVILEEVNHT